MISHIPSKEINFEALPKHLAIILDGNGRWATQRKMPRLYGHKKGAKTLESIIDYAFSLHIPYISVFAFSTENWKRPKEEVDGIFNILRDFINDFDKKSKKDREKEIAGRNIRLQVMGDISKLPQDLIKAIETKIEQTKECDGGVLNVALNYGGRADIVHACNRLIKEKKQNITEEDFVKMLYSGDSPDVDFVIRTGGDTRISNFMLYQMAYAELYFIKTYWPDFSCEDLDNALINYQNRKRKFGNITV